MLRFKPRLFLATFLFAWLAVPNLNAQWVMAAHAARNRIQRMSQHSENGGYDLATVILDAAPEKVYDKAVQQLKTHPEITITEENKAQGKIQFRKGNQVAGMQVNALSDKLTQLVIASNAEAATQKATPLVVESVLRVCKEFNVTCTVEGR
jgi:hypothetical protein